MRLSSLLCFLCLITGFAAAQDTNFAAGPQYLITTSSTLFLRPIATPSLSLGAPAPTIPNLPEVGASVSDQQYTVTPGSQNQADLFSIYYGYPRIVTVELTSTEPRELPAGIVDVGVRMTTPQALYELGFGTTLGEVSSFWKTHKPRAEHVYTNQDIERLHRGQS